MLPPDLYPVPTKLSHPFWAGCSQGNLCMQRCSDCGTINFYPVYVCTSCNSSDLEWETLSGRGRIHSLTTVHRASHPDLRMEAPYIVALIDLDEGVTMMSKLIGGNHGNEFKIGQPVEVSFEYVTEEISLPVFSVLRE